ncbi:MAG: class I SAM-dependent methyltransferase [Candidatus Dormibacteria bacterium]
MDHAATTNHFNRWYTTSDGSAGLEIMREHLGYPSGVETTSALPFEGLQEVSRFLDLAPDDVLIDVGCGRGSLGIWVAEQSGARLLGLDASEVAVEQARNRAGSLGAEHGRIDFRVGSLEDTKLSDGTADALMCIDSIAFADDIARAAREMRRVVQPGGRIVVTGWEAADRADTSLPERLRAVDLGNQLRAAGLSDVNIEERRGWTERERSMWHALESLSAPDDAFVQSLVQEAREILPLLDRRRRVMATARVESRVEPR